MKHNTFKPRNTFASPPDKSKRNSRDNPLVGKNKSPEHHKTNSFKGLNTSAAS